MRRALAVVSTPLVIPVIPVILETKRRGPTGDHVGLCRAADGLTLGPLMDGPHDLCGTGGTTRTGSAVCMGGCRL